MFDSSGLFFTVVGAVGGAAITAAAVFAAVMHDKPAPPPLYVPSDRENELERKVEEANKKNIALAMELVKEMMGHQELEEIEEHIRVDIWLFPWETFAESCVRSAENVPDDASQFMSSPWNKTPFVFLGDHFDNPDSIYTIIRNGLVNHVYRVPSPLSASDNIIFQADSFHTNGRISPVFPVVPKQRDSRPSPKNQTNTENTPTVVTPTVVTTPTAALDAQPDTPITPEGMLAAGDTRAAMDTFAAENASNISPLPPAGIVHMLIDNNGDFLGE